MIVVEADRPFVPDLIDPEPRFLARVFGSRVVQGVRERVHGRPVIRRPPTLPEPPEPGPTIAAHAASAR